MWRNPISDKRYSIIVNYVRKQLEKRKRQEIYQFRSQSVVPPGPGLENIFEQARLKALASIGEQLPHLGESDPTSSGQYCRWIVDLILRKNVSLPEDSQKLRELLEVYHKVKRRLPAEHREIKRFKSYHQLRTTLLPLLPSLKSTKELQREGMQLLHSDVIDGSKYDIHKLMTPEAASKAAQNTGWCVCNVNTAKSYMDTGPLYLILRNNERFILAHMEPGDQETIQIMDINDIPVHPSHKKHHYEEVAALFAKYLPQFLCKKHSSTFPLFPKTYKTATLYNLRCEICEEDGCHKSIQLCGVLEETEHCPTALCNECKKECDRCSLVVCSDHASECCSNNYGSSDTITCPAHRQECSTCDSIVCDSCRVFVECCADFVCDGCYQYCEMCSESYCGQHATFSKCDLCSEHGCGSCQESWVHVDCCQDDVCEGCIDKLDKCYICDDYCCPTCDHVCESCGKDSCVDCQQWCSDCNYGPYCRNCEAHDCEKCEDHTHQVFSCKECHKDGLCENCIVTCRGCNEELCEEHAISCDCIPDIRRGKFLHSYCPECYPANICPVCTKPMCIPEEHMACAYTPRRKRRLRRFRRR